MTASVRQVVTAGGRSYIVVDDRRLAHSAFIVGQAIDELTGLPPRERAAVQASLRGVPPHLAASEGRFFLTAGESGTFAVAGTTELAFPNLATNSFTLDLVVTAPSYLETPLSVTIPAGTTDFPMPALEVHLRRPAVLLRGRITTQASVPAPIAGAQIEVVNPAGMVGFAAPLAFTHDAANVARRTLTPIGSDLTLIRDIHVGDRELSLESRTLLSVGRVIQLGIGDDREYGVVERVSGPADLSRPGNIRLFAPVSFSHRRTETSARRVQLGAASAQTTLARQAFPGDQVVFLASNALTANQTFEIADVPGRVEYRVASPPTATTDTDGYYRIGPIGRQASITLRVTLPASPPEPDIMHQLDFNQPVNTLSLRF
jgi:hypothetical protein